MKQLKDKVIWITGASSGIGEALALRLAGEQARLVLSARRKDQLERVARLTGLAPLDLMVLPFDLADTSNASGLAAQVINKFGRIDILVNNGGMSQRSEVINTSGQIERLLMEVNFFAQVNLAKAVLPYMIRQKQGQIVVISSIAGKFGFFLRSSYSAAKHALFGYFDSLRLEVEKKGVNILLVSPGKIKTNVSINAVGPGGETHNKMDPSHEKAMSAERCAEIICNSLLTKKTELLVGGKELLMVRIKNYFPTLFNYLIRKQDPL